MLSRKRHRFDLSIYKNLSNKELLSHIDRVGVPLFQQDSIGSKDTPTSILRDQDTVNPWT
ncbi:MAG: hypothetical protein V4489_08820 [Chlamydiota bacterium]